MEETGGSLGLDPEYSGAEFRFEENVTMPNAPQRALAGIAAGILIFSASWGGAAEKITQKITTQTPAAAARPEPGGVSEKARGDVAATWDVSNTTGPEIRLPGEALSALKAGNIRFFSGDSRRMSLSAEARRAQVTDQTPFAVVLGCADSRVPIEIVFDQGPGDIFSIRVAGNVVDPATVGSVEYAVEHLNSQVVVLLGHEGCGAVNAALQPTTRLNEAENVRYLLDLIEPAVSDLPRIRDRKARVREAVVANVRWQVAQLKKNPIVAEAEAEGRIRVVGAFFEIASGAVDFLETEEELSVGGPPEEPRKN